MQGAHRDLVLSFFCSYTSYSGHLLFLFVLFCLLLLPFIPTYFYQSSFPTLTPYKLRVMNPTCVSRSGILLRAGRSYNYVTEAIDSGIARDPRRANATVVQIGEKKQPVASGFLSLA